MTSRPASSSRYERPLSCQFRAKDDAKPWTSRTGLGLTNHHPGGCGVHDAAVTRRRIVLLVVGALAALAPSTSAGAVTGGDVYPYGAPSFGSTAGTALNAPIVGMT